jgi:hypothetical protein
MLILKQNLCGLRRRVNYSPKSFFSFSNYSFVIAPSSKSLLSLAISSAINAAGTEGAYNAVFSAILSVVLAIFVAETLLSRQSTCSRQLPLHSLERHV